MVMVGLTADASGAGFGAGAHFAVVGVFVCQKQPATRTCATRGNVTTAIEPGGVPAGGGAFADAVRTCKQ